MGKIALTNGGYSIVDKAILKKVSQYRWMMTTQGYVERKYKVAGKTMHVFLHRFVLGLSKGDGFVVDHRNNNKLDNRSKNLRLCSHAENLRNRGLTRANTSGFKGVSWYKPLEKWSAKIRINGRKVHLGYFINKKEAARVYDTAAKKLHGEFAVLNHS